MTTTRLEQARRADTVQSAGSDELTLVDLRIFPAVGAAGTQSGGLWLAALRIPYTAVSGWWIVDGDEIPGSGGRGGTSGFGFAFELWTAARRSPDAPNDRRCRARRVGILTPDPWPHQATAEGR